MKVRAGTLGGEDDALAVSLRGEFGVLRDTNILSSSHPILAAQQP